MVAAAAMVVMMMVVVEFWCCRSRVTSIESKLSAFTHKFLRPVI